MSLHPHHIGPDLDQTFYPHTWVETATGKVMSRGTGHKPPVAPDGWTWVDGLAPEGTKLSEGRWVTDEPSLDEKRSAAKHVATHARIVGVASLKLESLRESIRLREEAGVPVSPEDREELRRRAAQALALHETERLAHEQIDQS